MWRFSTTTLWHFDAGEQGPSTPSFPDCRTTSPNAAMAAAYASGDYIMQDIAEHFGAHYATVSRAAKRGMPKMP